MFSKIRDKLKSVFKASEKIIEDDEEIVKEEVKIDKSVKKYRKNTEKVQKKVEAKVEEEKPKQDSVSLENRSEHFEQKSSKSFFSKLFGKKEEKDNEELEKVEEIMLEDVERYEKKAIKEKTKLDKKEVEKNKRKLEKQIEIENKLEKEALNDIDTKIKKSEKKEGFLSRTFTKLKSKKITVDDFDKIWIELEIFLLEINIAFEIVEKIGSKLREELIENSFNRFKLSEKIREVLESEVEEVLKHRESDLFKKINEVKEQDGLVKILILGVNGTGKTTTIAKIVNYFQKNNLSVVVAASDTFRAAAIEQLEEHSKKLSFKLITHKGGSDPAAVAYDAIEHAKAKKLDVVLIDTAGRMPNNSNLMMELQKIKRISQSQISIFIGDSISGNDLIDQIHLFNIGVEIDGIILTKVDTDERPGSIVTTAYSINKPIYFLGNGQNYNDLVKFDSKEVAKKLFEIDDEEN